MKKSHLQHIIKEEIKNLIKEDQATVDTILDKINAHGLGSLTSMEKFYLDDGGKGEPIKVKKPIGKRSYASDSPQNKNILKFKAELFDLAIEIAQNDLQSTGYSDEDILYVTSGPAKSYIGFDTTQSQSKIQRFLMAWGLYWKVDQELEGDEPAWVEFFPTAHRIGFVIHVDQINDAGKVF